ncbi:MAG: preprotein translocase subunit SecE [Clostridia bacterium]|nr:preprotein translocase subunit SecE [Clostridia bacterium]
MAKEVNDKENNVKKESAKKESTKKAATKKDAAKKDNKKSFFKDFKAELKRVSWPTPKQLINNTVAVITIVLVVCAIVFVLDVIFESLNTYGVEKLKALVTSSSSENVEENTNTVIENVTIDDNNVVSNEAETADDAQTNTANVTENTVTTNNEATTEQ